MLTCVCRTRNLKLLIKYIDIVMAYTLATPDKMGYADDEEHKIARLLMYHLKDKKVKDAALFMARHCVCEISEVRHELFPGGRQSYHSLQRRISIVNVNFFSI